MKHTRKAALAAGAAALFLSSTAGPATADAGDRAWAFGRAEDTADSDSALVAAFYAETGLSAVGGLFVYDAGEITFLATDLDIETENVNETEVFGDRNADGDTDDSVALLTGTGEIPGDGIGPVRFSILIVEDDDDADQDAVNLCIDVDNDDAVGAPYFCDYTDADNYVLGDAPINDTEAALLDNFGEFAKVRQAT